MIIHHDYSKKYRRKSHNSIIGVILESKLLSFIIYELKSDMLGNRWFLIRQREADAHSV